MISTFFRIAAFSLLCAEAFPAPTANGFPYNDEELNYSINWPSGLSLGEGHLRAKRSGPVWDFELALDAGIPGFPVKDKYQSQASAEFCSISFERNSSHGTRQTSEKTTIDHSRSTAVRVTQGKGGASEIPVADCVKDALTYLFFTRKELGQGRVPAPQA